MLNFLKLKSSHKVVYSSVKLRFGFGSSKNPYDILQIRRDASFKEAQAAFYKLSKLYHPDVSKEEKATKKFQEISAAFEKIKIDHRSKPGAAGAAGSTAKDAQSNYEKGYSSSTSKEEGKKTDSEGSQSENKGGFSDKEKTDKRTKAEREYEERKAKEEYEKYKQEKSMSEEELLYFKIFGKTFKEDPTFFYKAENIERKKIYEEQLDILRMKRSEAEGAKNQTKQEDYDEKKYYEEATRDYSANQTQTPDFTQVDSNMKNYFIGTCLIIGAVVIYIWNQEVKKLKFC